MNKLSNHRSHNLLLLKEKLYSFLPLVASWDKVNIDKDKKKKSVEGREINFHKKIEILRRS